MAMIDRKFATGTACACPTPQKSGVLRRILAWHLLARERIALSKLDDHLLEDLGLTREDAQKEANRPVWDAPDQWLR